MQAFDYKDYEKDTKALIQDIKQPDGVYNCAPPKQPTESQGLRSSGLFGASAPMIRRNVSPTFSTSKSLLIAGFLHRLHFNSEDASH
jgi:hypothetical protein